MNAPSLFVSFWKEVEEFLVDFTVTDLQRDFELDTMSRHQTRNFGWTGETTPTPVTRHFTQGHMRPISTLTIRISADVVAGVVILHPQYQKAVEPEPRYVAERRADGTCTNSKKHGKSVVGGRCQMCWDKKRAAEKLAKAAPRSAVAA